MSKRSTFVQRVKQKGPNNRSIHYPGHCAFEGREGWDWGVSPVSFLFCYLPPSLPPASYSEGGTPHEYNAHYIDAYFTPRLFIIADGPEENNAAKFWQMVWDQDCAYIIMLTPLDANVCGISLHSYLPPFFSSLRRV